MEENFSIDILHNGAKLSFDAKLVSFGYTYKILVNVNDIEVSFEPDDGGNYRAIVPNNFLHELKDEDKTIVGLITEQLDKIKDMG